MNKQHQPVTSDEDCAREALQQYEDHEHADQAEQAATSLRKEAGEQRLEYFCPHCHRLLNPGQLVVFIVEEGDHRELLQLSPVLGDYTVQSPGAFKLQLGTLYTFRCPLCHGDLVSARDDRMVEIESRTSSGKPCRVSFSRMFGERATVVCDDENVELYGENAAQAETNFFGEDRNRNG